MIRPTSSGIQVRRRGFPFSRLTVVVVHVRQFTCAIVLLSATALQPVGAQADSTRPSVKLFTFGDAALATTIMASALFARRLDEQYSLRLQDSSTQANARLRRISRIVRTTTSPGAVIIGSTMYAVGRLSHEEHLAAVGLHGSEALVVGELVGGLMKGMIGRQRPYVMPQNSHSYGFMRGFGGGDQYRSLPSGHSLAAFAVAAAVSSETAGFWPGTRWVIGPILYSGATLTGLSRMYDNRHWASDVIVGAGIGTFAGLKVVRYANNHDNRIDKLFLSASVVPASGGGHAFHWSILPGVSLPNGTRAH